MVKRSLLLAVLLCYSIFSFAQGYNQEKTALINFLTRMYENQPFEGVRAVDDYDNHYLLSVLSLEEKNYRNESDMFRVASVKAMAQASRFFNGATITSNLIIRTSEKSSGEHDTELIEEIKENSIGYVRSLELLSNFKAKNGRRVFLYMTPISLNTNKS